MRLFKVAVTGVFGHDHCDCEYYGHYMSVTRLSLIRPEHAKIWQGIFKAFNIHLSAGMEQLSALFPQVLSYR